MATPNDPTPTPTDQQPDEHEQGGWRAVVDAVEQAVRGGADVAAGVHRYTNPTTGSYELGKAIAEKAF